MGTNIENLPIDIFWTPRFANKYSKYAGIGNIIERKTAEILKVILANLLDWHREFERLKDDSFKGQKVVKVAVTHGDRMVFKIEENRLVFLDLGNHDVMQDYANLSSAAKESNLLNALPAPNGFMKKVAVLLNESKSRSTNQLTEISSLFDLTNFESDIRWRFEEELDEKWINFLDETQLKIKDEIINALRHRSDFSVHYLLGGPGTGKTIILLNLANQLANEGSAVSFESSINVKKYLESNGNLVPGFSCGPGPGVVLLIDDPGNNQELAMKIRHARTAGSKGVVVAIDPLQWTSNGEIQNFDSQFQKNNSKVYTLWVCYRQSRNIATKALTFVEKASKKALESYSKSIDLQMKETIEKYLNLSLGMEFVDYSGFFKIFETEWQERLIEQSNRIRERIDLWKHSPSLCIIYSPDILTNVKNFTKEVLKGINRKDVSFERVSEIRGLEFQEVIFITSKEFWDGLLNTVIKNNRHNWENAVNLHLAFSRAKDGMNIISIQ